MRRIQSVSAIQQQGRKPKLRKPSSRELDLLILAGCSCLLTVLHHPVAEALQTHAVRGAGAAIATQTGNASTNSMSAFHLITPPSKERDEEVKSEG